jgi:hypothetical protein
MYTPKAYNRSLRTRSEIVNMFANYPNNPAYPEPTDEQIDRIRAIQIAGARHGKLGLEQVTDPGVADRDGVYAEIEALETELDRDGAEVCELYSDAHGAFFRDGTINPGDRSDGSCFTFHFGAYGDTHVSVWSRSLEDALELAAEWLAKHEPGHLMTEDELQDLYREACEDAGMVYPQPASTDEMESVAYYAAREQAEADLTYTESGYLTSYEWTVDESDEAPGPDASARGARR